MIKPTVHDRRVSLDRLGMNDVRHQFGQPLRVQEVQISQIMVIEVQDGTCWENTIDDEWKKEQH